jgi:4-alpha-glucanotransferase
LKNIFLTDENKKLKEGLFDLISNIILFEEPDSQQTRFHFRIAMEGTASFRYLPYDVQQKLKELYVNYFFKRQDDFWYREAMQKLPHLKRTTNMMICGEDLGMVPHCVPDVMEQLGMLSLEIQRMPKKTGIEFFHPNDAPYLSVITPSTHDMSTIRGWWEEDRIKTQYFYNHILQQWGEAPYFCEAWINRAIILQHLNSPAMWSVFQLQDLLGMSEAFRRENPHEERINIPADPNHYWNFRMHLTLEDLLKEKSYNEELRGYIEHAGR